MKKRNIIDRNFIKIILLVIFIFISYRIVFDFEGITLNISSGLSFLMNLLSYFIWGFAIAFVLNQIMMAFERNFRFVKSERIRRSISVTLTYVLTLGLITLFFVAVVPVITSSIAELINNAQTYAKNIQNIYSQVHDYSYDKFAIDLSELINFDNTRIAEKITEFFVSGGVFPVITKWLSNTTNIMTNFIFGLIISIYMLIGKNNFVLGTQNIINALVPEKRRIKLFDIAKKANIIFSKFLFGKLIDAIFVGVISYIGFNIIGVKYPLLLAFILGIMNLIPYFGPILGAIVCCGIILLTNAEFYIFIISVLFVIIMQQFDAWFVEPKILHGQIGVNPLVIIAGVSIGGSLGGFIGMLIGVPLMALIKELFYDEYILKKLKSKKNPETNDEIEQDKNEDVEIENDEIKNDNNDITDNNEIDNDETIV